MKPSGQGFFRENQLQAAVIPTGAGRTLWGDAEMAELCIGGAGPSQKLSWIKSAAPIPRLKRMKA